MQLEFSAFYLGENQVGENQVNLKDLTSERMPRSPKIQLLVEHGGTHL